MHANTLKGKIIKIVKELKANELKEQQLENQNRHIPIDYHGARIPKQLWDILY
jgi:hypothetical protein